MCVLAYLHISIGLPFDFTCGPCNGLYSCEIWGFIDYDKCQALEHRAQRTYLSVGKFCPMPNIKGETGWTPVIIKHVAMVRLWLKLVNLPENRPTKFVFTWDHKMVLSGTTKCWSREVKEILEQCDHGNM